MSLVEVLVASVLIVVVTVGVLPLFTSSMASNRAGGDSTVATALARSSLEELNQLSFGDALLLVPGGATELVSEAHRVGEEWVPTATPAASWRRVIRVRQYSVVDLTLPLDGAADPSNVHLKEIEVSVFGTRQLGNALGPSRRITLRQFKSQ